MSSNSPFADPTLFYQSSLTFYSPVGVTSVDERGNQMRSTMPFTLRASLKSSNLQTGSGSDEEEEDNEVNAIAEGLLTDPMKAPEWLKPGAVGTGDINGKVGQVVLVSVKRFNLVPVADILGDKIKVKFVESVKWGSN